MNGEGEPRSFSVMPFESCALERQLQAPLSLRTLLRCPNLRVQAKGILRCWEANGKGDQSSFCGKGRKKEAGEGKISDSSCRLTHDKISKEWEKERENIVTRWIPVSHGKVCDKKRRSAAE